MLETDYDEEQRTVQSVTLVVKVLLEADTPEEAANQVMHMDLGDYEREMDTGDFIGHVSKPIITTVDPKTLRAHLEAIGNDGTFFGKITEPQGEVASASTWLSTSERDQAIASFLEENGLMDAFEAHVEARLKMAGPFSGPEV